MGFAGWLDKHARVASIERERERVNRFLIGAGINATAVLLRRSV